MVNIQNASSLFEIMFAVNAVFAFIVSRYSKNKIEIYKHIHAEAKRHGIDLMGIDEKYLKEASYLCFTNFRPLNEIFLRVGVVLSSSGVLVSIGLLIWASVIPEGPTISTTSFCIILFIFLFFSPLYYYSFSFLSKILIVKIQQTLISDVDVQIIFELAQNKIFLEQQKKILLEIEAKNIKNELIRKRKKVHKLILETLNPVHHYKRIRYAKILREVERIIERNQAKSQSSSIESE